MMEYSINIALGMNFDTSFISFKEVGPQDTATRFEQLAFLAKASCIEEAELPKMLHNFYLGQPYGGFWMNRIDVKRDRFLLYLRRDGEALSDNYWIVFPFDETIGTVTIANQSGDEGYQISWNGSLNYVSEVYNRVHRQYEPDGALLESNESYLGKCTLTEQYPFIRSLNVGH